MKILLAQLKEQGGQYVLVLVLVSLAIIEGIFLSYNTNTNFLGASNSLVGAAKETVREPIRKISEISSPSIDGAAAMIAVSSQTISCFTLPVNIWIILLIMCVSILVFNFSYTFSRVSSPQWFWEALYTLCFVFLWFVWDECRTNMWFPFFILKFGLITFALYLYLLERKKGETLAI